MGKKVYRRTTLLCFGFASFLAGLVLARRVILGEGVLMLVVCFAPLLWRRTKLSLLSICCIGLLLGCWRGSVFMRALLPYHLLARQPVTIRVQVLSDGVYAERSQLRFDVGNIALLEPRAQHLIGSLDVSGFGVRQVQRGDTVMVRGKLYPTRGSRQARISFAQIQRVGKGGSALDALRKKFAAGLQSALPEPTASLALGILVGQRTTLPDSLNNDLSITGLTHIVAVSGYNLTVIVQLVRRLLEKRSKYQATTATLTLMFGFILLTGMSASVVRAGVVSGLSLWAWYYGRTFKPLLLLLLSACLTAGWFPPYVWSDLGWHLSFLAFGGILLFAPLLVRACGWHRVHPVVGLVIETVAAQLMTLPLILYVFGRLSVIALLANMLIVPLVPVAMLLSMVAGLGAMLAPAVAGWWAWPARLLLTYMTDLTTLTARLPFASLQVHFSAWQMIACYLCLILVMVVWWRKGQQNGKITDRIIDESDENTGRKEEHMSGHSKWSTIKRQKGAKDAARGAVFTKLGNAIAIAARAGADPDMNFTLRLAIDKAKAANMPMANIQRSIDRGSGKLGGAQIQEVLYEGYGPGGVAILVECATDNINRTYPEVKLAFSKNGGNIAEKGAVAFQFDHKGMIRVKGSGDELMLTALDAGAEDMQEEGDESVIYTAKPDLAKVRDTLKDQGIEILEAELTYVPNNTVEVTDPEVARKLMKVMNALEDLDDVSNTHVNFDIADDIVVA